MRLYSYIVKHDTGFSPNPFWGYCTLACCKPVIRRTACVGDWIVGLSPRRNGRGNNFVYAMQIQEILSHARYYYDPRFRAKIPDHTKNEVVYKCGDNIYEPLSNGEYAQHRSMHSCHHMKRDLSGRHVLIATNFCYFGAEALDLPEELRDLKVTRGHKCKFSPETISRFMDFVARQPSGINSRPSVWPNADYSWRTEGRETDLEQKGL